MKSNRRYQAPGMPSKSMCSGLGSSCAETRASYRARAAAHAMQVLFSTTLEASRRARGADAVGGYNLAMVCGREQGIVLYKASQTSNSSRRPPKADQLKYAALDAEVLLALHERFKEVGGAADPGGGN